LDSLNNDIYFTLTLRKENSEMAQSEYSKYIVQAPLREVGASMNIKGVTTPTYTYMSNKLVPGCNVYLELSWIYQMPEPSLVVPATHSHPYDQLTLLIGSDPQNPEYLGAEIGSYLGGEKLISDKTTATFMPKNVEHGHVQWKSFERPHIMMSIMLGTGDLVKANPGGLIKES
jgi:hypothetical protein